MAGKTQHYAPDHEFVCLSSGLDPLSTSFETALSNCDLKFFSAGEMIAKRIEQVPQILHNHIRLLADCFCWKGYKQRNQDLKHLSPFQLVEHFLNYGIYETRHWNKKASLLDRRFAWAIYSSKDVHLNAHIQAIAHVYHYDVLCSLLPYLRTLARLGTKIYLFVSNEKLGSCVLDEFLDSLYTGACKHEWYKVENHGEDWSSFHEAYRRDLFQHEGITFKIQTKKSSNLGADGGLAWIDEALGPICGNQNAISITLEKLVVETNAIAASAAVARSGFGANPSLVENLIKKICSFPPNAYSDSKFASGSMFALRNSTASNFYAKLGNVDYSQRLEEGSVYCGRFIGHGLERVFFYHALDQSNYSAHDQGVSWI